MVAACVAVITVVPPLTTEMRPLVELTVATAVFELPYVIAPVLADDGIDGVNG